MIELEMHWSSGYYNDSAFLPSPLDPRCSNCEFLPDNECGWGYNFLSECVFQIETNTSYILYPTYDMVREEGGKWGIMENGKIDYYNEKWHRIVVIEDSEMLEECLENAEIIGMDPYWSSLEEQREFYETGWERRRAVREILTDKEKDIEHGWQWDDYLRWSFKKEPCSLCGKVTKEFIVFGFRSRCKTSPVIKVCTSCIGQSVKFYDGDGISFDELLIYGD